MKNIIFFILLCSIILGCFSGCSIPNDNTGEQSSNTESETTEPVTTKPVTTDVETTNKPEKTEAPTTEPIDATTTEPEETETKETERPKENYEFETSEELRAVFDMLSLDADTNEKIDLYIEDGELHYELKNSGEYKDDYWSVNYIAIDIICDYDVEINEDWYKQCSKTNVRSINQAFYDQYFADVSENEKESSAHFYQPGIGLSYLSLDAFCGDYNDIIKALLDLDYVILVEIFYYYGLPAEFITGG